MAPRTAHQLMKDNLIVKHYAGSIAYGTNLPTSDVDFRGVFSADPIHIRTPFYTVKECDDRSEEDTKLYELTHFLKLCVDCNPNIVETLWTDESDIIEKSSAYDFLRSHRYDLLSARIAFTTTGYAKSQLDRIKGHNKWINNPQPIRPPKQTDYVSLVHNFTNKKMFKIDLENFYNGYRLVPYEGNLFGLYKMDGYTTYNWDDYTLNTNYDADGMHTYKNWFGQIKRRQPLFIIKFNKDIYNEAKTKHKQYWEWKNNRNEVRSELEEKFGYDTKHAMHLYRLLRMGHEVLTTGELLVKRPDAEELLAVRNGIYTYEEIVKYAEDMDKKVYELAKKTSLRKKPDLELASKILMEAQDICWSNR